MTSQLAHFTCFEDSKIQHDKSRAPSAEVSVQKLEIVSPLLGKRKLESDFDAPSKKLSTK